MGTWFSAVPDWDQEPIIDLAELPLRKCDGATIELVRGDFEVGTVIRDCGTWAVTDYGIECLTNYYPIEKDRLYAKPEHYDWPRHMVHKRWIVMADFLKALAEGRRYHFPHGRPITPTDRKRMRKVRAQLTPSLRFQIFQRDNYRCCLCGASAATGATLEVDHRIPVSQGGLTLEANLWTLCFNCNRGKAARGI